MHSPLKHDLRSIAAAFDIPGEFASGAAYGSGHINDTYASAYEHDGKRIRYIHQRINHNIFKDPVALMENISRVTSHSRQRLEAAGDPDVQRRTLTIIPSREGLAYHQDRDGNTWRTYRFIERARTFDAIENAVQATQAAKAFGEFQMLLSDLPGKRLHETIPNFHHTPRRLAALVSAVEKDAMNRAVEARKEIDFVMSRAALTNVIVDKQAAGIIPERIIHNDTKLNNVMLDEQTMQGICVIDLDTVMPGSVAYDFGDMVRTATSPRPEDETDLSLIQMQMPMFRALVDGYLTSAHHFLTAAEKEHLAFGGKLITLEIGIRFLTDFLEGDSYFKIKREKHNLDRARAQFRLVESIEGQEEAMEEVVRAWKPVKS